MISRFLFNFLLFALLLGVIGGMTMVQTGNGSVVDVVLVTVLGASWAGGLIALIETRIYPLQGGKRLALAALCGGLAYVGLFAGLATLTTSGGTLRFDVPPAVLAIGGFVIGAVSHAVRARLYGDAETKEE